MKKSYLVSAALAAVLFSGCGGGSGSASSTGTSTGIFADAPVQGLSYKTATQSGFTDAQGHFKYKDGETVEFKLGTLFLGKGKAGAFVTPYTISDNNTTAINIALVLQNFDGNRNNAQVLDLSKLKDYNFTSYDINITAAPSLLGNKLAGLLATGSFQTKVDDTNTTLIAKTEVKKNMDDYIHKYETEHSKVTTPTSGTLPDVSAYNNIAILKSVSSTVADNLGNAVTDPYVTQDVSANTSCSDFGFSGTPMTSTNAGVTTKMYIDSSTQRVCSETDYTQATSSVLHGSRNALFALKQSSLNTQTPTITGSGSTTTTGSQTTITPPSALPSLDTYGYIEILQHTSPTTAAAQGSGIGVAIRLNVSNQTSCQDFGFTNQPTQNTGSYGEIRKNYVNYTTGQTCMEIDYTNAVGPTGLSMAGSNTVLHAYNI